jgi:hypothetical protein
MGGVNCLIVNVNTSMGRRSVPLSLQNLTTTMHRVENNK